MAKEGKLGWGGGINRRPSFKGRVVVSSWKGRPRISIQPIRDKKKISARQKEAMAKFSEAAELAKLCAPSQQLAAYELTNGTQYFPRDLLYMAFYGRIGTLILDSERKVYSVAARNDVSEVLDAIGQLLGEILYRDQDGWRALPAGEDETVLTMLDGKPVWLAGGGGGGGSGYRGATVIAPGLGWSTTGRATMAQPFTPVEVFSVATLVGSIRSNLGVTSARCHLFRLVGDGSTGEIAEVLHSSDPVALAENQAHTLRFAIEDPINVEPGTAYAVGVSRVNGNNGDNISYPRFNELNGALLPNAPVILPQYNFGYSFLNPLAGATPTTTLDGQCINWPEG